MAKDDRRPLTTNPLARCAGGVFDEAREIGDALSGSKAADGAHRLLPICGVNPGAEGMRNDESGKQDQQGLAEQALGQKSAHSWLTVGVNM